MIAQAGEWRYAGEYMVWYLDAVGRWLWSGASSMPGCVLVIIAVQVSVSISLGQGQLLCESIFL